LEIQVTRVDWLFDGALAIGLPIVAWCLVVARALRVAVALFIAFGLLSSLAWTRLDAVDVALVEAALGTGLTGALLLSTLSWAETSLSPRAPSGFTPVALGLALVGGAFRERRASAVSYWARWVRAAWAIPSPPSS
jgi:uncharacterized MnhB-related membrane protein